MKYIDLHTHTRYSDGTSTVENSLKCAQSIGLSILSVSDHNTVAAYREIMEKRELFSGKILPAVELTAIIYGNVVEVLGYGIDISEIKKAISENYLCFHDKQIAEAKNNVQCLLNRGAKLDGDFVRCMLESPNSIFDPNKESCRPALLTELRRHRENAVFFKSQQEFETIGLGAFSRKYIYNPESSLYCDQSSLFPSLRHVIDIIHSCGGLAFLAHAFIYTDGIVKNIDVMIDHGLDGLECYYGTFNAQERDFLCKKCREHGIYMSGGSDFHGLDMRPDNIMGASSGVKIPESLISDWKDIVSQKFI